MDKCKLMSLCIHTCMSPTTDLVLAVTILASAVIALPVVPIVYFVMKKKGDVREGQ